MTGMSFIPLSHLTEASVDKPQNLRTAADSSPVFLSARVRHVLCPITQSSFALSED